MDHNNLESTHVCKLVGVDRSSDELTANGCNFWRCWRIKEYAFPSDGDTAAHAAVLLDTARLSEFASSASN